MSNTLCNGLVRNTNPKSPIKYFELITVREYNDYEGGTVIEQVKNADQLLTEDWGAVDEPFYQIYGQIYTNDLFTKNVFLAQFFNIETAKNFLYNITGDYPEIVSY